MKQYYVIIIALSFIAINAADSSDVITFYTQHIKGANVERRQPRIEHFLELDRRETVSGKKFSELLHTNAVQHKTPWIIDAHMITSANGTSLDYFDIVEFLKNDSHFSDFSSTQASTTALLKTGKNACDKAHPYEQVIVSQSSMCLFYYQTEKSNYIRFPNLSNVTDMVCSTATTFNKEKICMSEVSCALSIAIQRNYSQLIPMIILLIETKSHLTQHKLDFWLNTFISLPVQTQEQLHKECKERYGVDITISTGK